MTKEEKKIIFKGLCESLPYGVKCVHFDKQKKILPTIGSSNNWIGLKAVVRSLDTDNIYTPIFYPLSMLDKPIIVEGYNDGKEFVPIDYLFKMYPRVTKSSFGMLQDIKSMVDMMEFSIVQELQKMGFWIYDQSYFEKGYLIDKSKL
jgi:hypothetical protein